MLMRADFSTKHEDPALQDVDSATATLYEFIQMEDRPLRLPLGKDTLKDVKERNECWRKTYQFCEKFSDDLLRGTFERLQDVVQVKA